MQFTTLFTLVGAAFFAATGVQAAGNFAASCTGWYMSSNTVFNANCGNGRGGRVNSSINLNGCITNRNGNLACQGGGNYGNSCSGCLIQTGSTMKCTCTGRTATIDLNQCVRNSSGNLACAT